MKVTHLNASDLDGGAAIASYRLHRAFVRSGVDSRMLVGHQLSTDERVARVPFPRRPERLIGRLTEQLGLKYIHIRSARDLAGHPWLRDADVINLHNLHGGYFNYRHLYAIVGDKPVVMTPHDMWAFSGHCSYSFECERYRIGCGKCPHLDVYPCVKRDATAIEWRLKRRAYESLHMHIAAGSTWQEERVRQSMLGRFPTHLIPIGLDLSTFRPLDRAVCRSSLGIAKDKQVLMFAAAALDDPRKGGDLLLGALRALPADVRANMQLLTMGAGGESIASRAGMPATNLGYVTSDEQKTIAYNTADLFVFPTRAEIFGLVMQESIACGTPVVSFTVGGVTDLVRPGVTGELVSPEDVPGLTLAITQLLGDPSQLIALRRTSRETAEREYSDLLMAQRYIGLYESVSKSSLW